MKTISNNHLSLSFDSQTGRLIAIHNSETGNSCLNQKQSEGNPFAIYYDFHQEYELPGIPNDSKPLPDPAKLTKKVFTPLSAEKVRMTQTSRGLQIIYHEGPWQVKLSISLKDESSLWHLQIKNSSNQPCQMMGVFPFINGIRLGKGRKNLMVVNDEAGYVRPLWSPGKERGGVYGQASIMSMQWGCLFDDETKDALGFIIEDKDIRNKEIIYDKPSVQVRYFPPVFLSPGEVFDFPSVRLFVYTGDWKPTASKYHRWFTRNFKTATPPSWVRSIDSYRGRWVFKHNQELSLPDEANKQTGYFMSSFSELPVMLFQEPADIFETAFFARAGMGFKASGKRFAHTDGDNIVREDLGGIRALQQGIKNIHRLGGHLTLYIEGYIVNDDAEIVLKGKARDWTVMNKDGTNNGVYTQHQFLHMCPGSAGWQNHLARTCSELVRRTGADGIRLDSLGCYFFPCYNPKHHHENPWDFNRWIMQLLDKVAREVHKVNPDCFLTTEAGADFFSRYFHGCLTQYFTEAPVAISRDVPPMRVALPEYNVLLHPPHGPVSSSLAGYPGGAVYWNKGGVFPEYEQKWRVARFPVAEVLRWGNAAYENPQASQKDVTCRRFSTAGMEVITGARYKYSGNHIGGHVEVNGNITIKTGHVPFNITVKDWPKRPRHIYLIDILNQTACEITPQKKCVSVNCNWFLMISLFDHDQPLAWLKTSMPATPGQTLCLNVDLIGKKSTRPVQATLKAPSLKINQKITIPGTIQLLLANNVPPGTHLVTLEAKGILGARTFITVKS
jgi:hypothetical protein